MKTLRFTQLVRALGYGLNPKNRPDTYVISILVLAILLYIKFSSELSLHGILSQKANSDMLGLILDSLTLVGVFLVWFSDLSKDWTQQLEKYLSVTFMRNGEPDEALSEKFARLTSESDIRSMAQSLGQANNNNQRLSIKPAIETLRNSIQLDDSKLINRGEPFNHYEVTIELKEEKAVSPALSSNAQNKYQSTVKIVSDVEQYEMIVDVEELPSKSNENNNH